MRKLCARLTWRDEQTANGLPQPTEDASDLDIFQILGHFLEVLDALCGLVDSGMRRQMEFP